MIHDSGREQKQLIINQFRGLQIRGEFREDLKRMADEYTAGTSKKQTYVPIPSRNRIASPISDAVFEPERTASASATDHPSPFVAARNEPKLNDSSSDLSCEKSDLSAVSTPRLSCTSRPPPSQEEKKDEKQLLSPEFRLLERLGPAARIGNAMKHIVRRAILTNFMRLRAVLASMVHRVERKRRVSEMIVRKYQNTPMLLNPFELNDCPYYTSLLKHEKKIRSASRQGRATSYWAPPQLARSFVHADVSVRQMSPLERSFDLIHMR